MKKILFASTALVATAGVAAADVSFGGFGRFGVFYLENDGGDGSVDEARVEQRFRLTVTGQTETDGGVGFEGRIRFQTDDQANGQSNVANNSAAGFAVTYGGLRVDVGHVSDVIDSGDVVNYYGSGVGLTSSIEQSTGHGLPASGFGTGDSPVDPTIKLRYEINSFTFSASVTDDTSVEGTNEGDNSEYQVGFGYAFGNYKAGIAFGNTEGFTATVDNPATPDVDESGLFDEDYVAASFSGDLGAFGFSILVTDVDADGWDTSYGVSATYDISAATTLVGVYSNSGNPALEDEDAYGIGVNHSLGGGVTLKAGIGEVQGNTLADMGVVFNF
ncbi:porin [Sulfitobacter sp. S190]|uniref:porin n=1 Tax=Sulfitobacter sp. S190 TaxID=2867022 RepID=UPI0021A4D30B|nr:porin [Sulfitobacter sp. S190]UWR22249.1 porin [Sulfitobacter sp. S190]